MRHAGRGAVALGRMVLVLGLIGAASLLSGCAEMHHGFQAVSKSTTSSAAADETAAPRAGVSARVVTQPDSDVPIVRMAAVPAPREIFDFHPNGSRPDEWRQPFIIDPNDGPLAADVRKTAEELKAFNAGLRSAPKVVVVRSCSETDVAAQKRGCVARTPTGGPPPTPAAEGAGSVLR